MLILLFDKVRKSDDLIVNLHADLVPIKSDIAHPQDPAFAKTWNTATMLSRYYPSLPKAIYFAICGSLNRKMIKRSLVESKILVSNSSFVKEASFSKEDRVAQVKYRILGE